MSYSAQKGFTWIYVLVAVVVFWIIGTGGWYWYKKGQASIPPPTSSVPKISNALGDCPEIWAWKSPVSDQYDVTISSCEMIIKSTDNFGSVTYKKLVSNKEEKLPTLEYVTAFAVSPDSSQIWAFVLTEQEKTTAGEPIGGNHMINVMNMSDSSLEWFRAMENIPNPVVFEGEIDEDLFEKATGQESAWSPNNNDVIFVSDTTLYLCDRSCIVYADDVGSLGINPYPAFFRGDKIYYVALASKVKTIQWESGSDTYIDINREYSKYKTAKTLGEFAKGSGRSYAWIAMKDGDKWKIIWKGQEAPRCEDIDKYNVPASIYENCYESSGVKRFPVN